jgi:hypothetical protein
MRVNGVFTLHCCHKTKQVLELSVVIVATLVSVLAADLCFAAGSGLDSWVEATDKVQIRAAVFEPAELRIYGQRHETAIKTTP